MFPYTKEEIAALVKKAAAFYWKTRRGQARKPYLHLAARIQA